MDSWKRNEEGGTSQFSPVFGRQLRGADSHKLFLKGWGNASGRERRPRELHTARPPPRKDRKYPAASETTVVGGILPSSFGTFGGYLAARVNALTSLIGITQSGAIGPHALVVTNDVEGKGTITTGKTGQFAALTTGALQETHIVP